MLRQVAPELLGRLLLADVSRPLREITAELKTFDGEDQEEEHVKADDLLIEALKTLSAYATETEDEGEVWGLIEAYEEIPKWYA